MLSEGVRRRDSRNLGITFCPFGIGMRASLSKNAGGLKVNHMSIEYSRSAAARNPMHERIQMSIAVIVSASGMFDLSELPMLTSMRKMVTRSDILKSN